MESGHQNQMIWVKIIRLNLFLKEKKKRGEEDRIKITNEKQKNRKKVKIKEENEKERRVKEVWIQKEDKGRKE